MNLPVYNWTIFLSFFTDQNLMPIVNKIELLSWDEYIMWWKTTFWAITTEVNGNDLSRKREESKSFKKKALQIVNA